MTLVQEFIEVYPQLTGIFGDACVGKLPHVSDCDGLPVMVETLPDDVAGRILSARKAAQEANLDVLAWADTVRERRA